jgi:hypothetical protein
MRRWKISKSICDEIPIGHTYCFEGGVGGFLQMVDESGFLPLPIERSHVGEKANWFHGEMSNNERIFFKN